MDGVKRGSEELVLVDGGGPRRGNAQGTQRGDERMVRGDLIGFDGRNTDGPRQIEVRDVRIEGVRNEAGLGTNSVRSSGLAWAVPSSKGQGQPDAEGMCTSAVTAAVGVASGWSAQPAWT